MSSILPPLITMIQLYGYPALGITIFVAAIGVPLPINLLLLAAGSFAVVGDFNIVLLALIGITAATAGDSIGYFVGRQGGGRLFHWLEQQQRLPFLSPTTVTRSRLYFAKRGGWAIFLSRFLFSALGGPINLLAGAELYPYRRFLVFDFCGEVLGSLIPLSLGYALGASWEAAGDILASISLFILALLLTVYLSFRLIRLLRRVKTVNGDLHTVASDSFMKGVKKKTDLLPL